MLRVGSDVWIGIRSLILSGVEVGHGAVIGGGSVVTKDVEPYEMVAGVPAERIGWRFDEDTRKELLDIAWWDWPDEKITDNKRFFNTDLRDADDITGLIT
ncbi:MAG TPA: DapH/DapD/GlmU-related protein [Halococcus sp.]|nr:DapH/DapD/GlmU-related protein [Halococcus sp.]